MVKMPLGLRDKDLLKTAVDFFAKTLPPVLVMANPYQSVGFFYFLRL